MKKLNLNTIIFAALFFLLISISAEITLAEDNFETTDLPAPTSRRSKQAGEILTKREITADFLIWDYEAKKAVFTGNVIMKGEEGEISSSQMTIFFDEEDNTEKISAESDANLTRDNQTGGGEIMEIYPDNNLIIIKQNAWISSNKATFRGEEIHLDTEKEIIKITKGVRGQIQTGSEKEGL